MLKNANSSKIFNYSDIDTALAEGWYLLRVKPNSELRAEQNLLEQNIPVYCPYITIKLNKRALFQGYLFICLKGNLCFSFHRIKYTRGIVGFVCFDHGSKHIPTPIPEGDKIINDVKNIESAFISQNKANLTQTAFQKGDKVKLNCPLLQYFQGEFIKQSGAGRGLLLVQYIKSVRHNQQICDEIIGKKLIQVPLNQLQKTASSPSNHSHE